MLRRPGDRLCIDLRSEHVNAACASVQFGVAVCKSSEFPVLKAAPCCAAWLTWNTFMNKIKKKDILHTSNDDGDKDDGDGERR